MRKCIARSHGGSLLGMNHGEVGLPLAFGLGDGLVVVEFLSAEGATGRDEVRAGVALLDLFGVDVEAVDEEPGEPARVAVFADGVVVLERDVTAFDEGTVERRGLRAAVRCRAGRARPAAGADRAT